MVWLDAGDETTNEGDHTMGMFNMDRIWDSYLFSFINIIMLLRAWIFDLSHVNCVKLVFSLDMILDHSFSHPVH